VNFCSMISRYICSSTGSTSSGVQVAATVPWADVCAAANTRTLSIVRNGGGGDILQVLVVTSATCTDTVGPDGSTCKLLAIY
jgi:hypothetical protein